MRAILMLAVALGIFGCEQPAFDLREPIYLVAEDSFWQGCDDDPAGYEACAASRVAIIYESVDMWFRHWSAENRPLGILISKGQDVPGQNEPVYLKIDWSECRSRPGAITASCFSWGPSDPVKIIFKEPKYITLNIMTHEFGHVLGLDDNTAPDGKISIMSYGIWEVCVVPLDIEMVCELHREVKCPELMWCEGAFAYKYHCPSVSPEEGFNRPYSLGHNCDL
jgi:hypothetical protein